MNQLERERVMSPIMEKLGSIQRSLNDVIVDGITVKTRANLEPIIEMLCDLQSEINTFVVTNPNDKELRDDLSRAMKLLMQNTREIEHIMVKKYEEND